MALLMYWLLLTALRAGASRAARIAWNAGRFALIPWVGLEAAQWSRLSGFLIAAMFLIQAAGASVLRVGVLSGAERDEGLAAFGCVWLACVLTWILLMQAGGTGVLSAGLGISIMACTAVWLTRRVRLTSRCTTLAMWSFALCWTVQWGWERRGLLSLAHLSPQPVAAWMPALLAPVDAGTVAVCGVAVTLARMAIGVRWRVRPWVWTVLLAGLCLTSSFPASFTGPGLGLSLTVCLLVIAGLPRRSIALATAAILLPAMPAWWGLAACSASYPGNGRPDRASSAEGLSLQQHYALSRSSEGTVLGLADLAALLPAALVSGDPAHVNRLAFDRAALRDTVDSAPAWLFYSNNPEHVGSACFIGSTAVLFRASVPAGRGRVFASHFTPGLGSARLLVAYHNDGSTPVTLRLHTARMSDVRATLMLGDAGTALWQAFERSDAVDREAVVGPAGTFIDGTAREFGNVLMMTDVSSSGPLTLSAALTRDTDAAAAAAISRQAVAPRHGGQSRGVFFTPDDTLTVDVDLDDPHMRAALLSSEPLCGDDPTLPSPTGEPVDSTSRTVERLAGNYGAITHLHAHFHRNAASPWHRALVLLVPVGGTAGAVLDGRSYSVPVYGGLVLYNRQVASSDDFLWDYTLPANGYAPVVLVTIPLKR